MSANTERKTNRQKFVRRNQQQNKLTMYSHVSPVATRLRTKLNYATQITPAAIPVYEYLFNLNSLFDPDRTATGHQPLGFDQLKTLYNRYRVYKVDYDIQWVTTTSDPVMIIAVPTNESPGIGSLETSLETYSARCSRAGNVYSPCRIQGTVDLALLNGKTLQQYTDDDTTQAVIGSSPSELLILHACFASLSVSNVTGYATVKLVMHSEFSDPVQLSAS